MSQWPSGLADSFVGREVEVGVDFRLMGGKAVLRGHTMLPAPK